MLLAITPVNLLPFVCDAFPYHPDYTAHLERVIQLSVGTYTSRMPLSCVDSLSAQNLRKRSDLFTLTRDLIILRGKTTAALTHNEDTQEQIQHLVCLSLLRLEILVTYPTDSISKRAPHWSRESIWRLSIQAFNFLLFGLNTQYSSIETFFRKSTDAFWPIGLKYSSFARPVAYSGACSRGRHAHLSIAKLLWLEFWNCVLFLDVVCIGLRIIFDSYLHKHPVGAFQSQKTPVLSILLAKRSTFMASRSTTLHERHFMISWSQYETPEQPTIPFCFAKAVHDDSIRSILRSSHGLIMSLFPASILYLQMLVPSHEQQSGRSMIQRTLHPFSGNVILGYMTSFDLGIGLVINFASGASIFCSYSDTSIGLLGYLFVKLIERIWFQREIPLSTNAFSLSIHQSSNISSPCILRFNF
jgi:hypothetical protein